MADGHRLLVKERREGDLSFREILPGLIYSHIYRNADDRRISYEIFEPQMSPVAEEEYRKRISKIIESGLSNGTSSKRWDYLFSRESKHPASNILGESDLDVVEYYVNRDISRYGKITGLLLDPDVEDISCEGAIKPVFVFMKAYGFIPTNVSYATENELNFFIRKIVQDSGKNISVASPIVDSTLPDGSRIQASIGGDVTPTGPAFSIRKFRKEPLTPLDLIGLGTAPSEVFAYLWLAVEYGANIIITGGTASGKTVMLNSILLFIPQNQKIITIEDTRELRLPHDNWLSLISREGTGRETRANGKRLGQIDMFDLLTASLRHRPNYIVIGEVRGREAFTIFQAMSTGRYGLATFHAEDIDTLIHRLESEPINIPRNLIGSLDAVIVMGNFVYKGETRRRVKSLLEVMPPESHRGELTVNKVYSLNHDDTFSSSGFSYLLQKIGNRYGIPASVMEKDVQIRKGILESMIRKGSTNYDEFTGMIFSFYHDRDKVIEMYGV
ncbi:MAG: type II/IV secretion system ATPase subunit [Thermoplasmataceae archaeon]